MAPPTIPSASPVYFISGANRGIGLGLVQEVLSQFPSAVVVAGARSSSGDAAKALQALAASKGAGRLHVVQLDVSDEASIKEAARWVDDHVGRVDVLINNSGVAEMDLRPWNERPFSEALNILAVNVVGPLALSAALLPALHRGQRKTIAHISSTMGSLTERVGEIHSVVKQVAAGGEAPFSPFGNAFTMYRTSKVALNTEMLSMAGHLAPEGFTVLSLHPGWVETDMGNTGADFMNAALAAKAKESGAEAAPVLKAAITAVQSAAGLLAVITSSSAKDSGSFLDWEGKTVAW